MSLLNFICEKNRLWSRALFMFLLADIVLKCEDILLLVVLNLFGSFVIIRVYPISKSYTS